MCETLNNDHLKYFHAKDTSRERERERERERQRERRTDRQTEGGHQMNTITI